MTEMLLGQSSPRGLDPWGKDCWRRTRWRRWCNCTGWAGHKSDCRRGGVQPEYGEALACGGRLRGDPPATPAAASRRAR
jgi:hypothetical protein